MKTFLKTYAFILLASVFFSSCKKDETKLYYTGGTAPELTLTPGAKIEYANADSVALTLNWTNPDYTFTTGVSSLDVSYNIEIDTDAAFNNPSKKIITVSKDLSYSFLASELNDIMLNQLNLDTGVTHTLELRVISSLVNNTAQLTSNAVQFTATPYTIPPKVEPPASGELYLTGSATKGGWMVGGGVGVPPDQQFQKIDETHFTITVDLIGGQEYLFVPVNGDWSHKYAVKDKTLPNLWQGGDFYPDASDNFPGPPASGSYKIDVDFQKGKFTVTKQ